MVRQVVWYSIAKKHVLLEGRNWEVQLTAITDSLVFIDEGNAFVHSKAFASAIPKTDNYYIIVTREGIETLPYSVTEIYGIRNSGKYGTLKQTYNELYRIYGKNDTEKIMTPDIIITEDSNAGFQFYESICKKDKVQCLSANGKSIIIMLLTQHNKDRVLIIADGAAFGSQMEKITAGIIKDAELNGILREPTKFIESSLYFSWERYFTSLLIKKTDGTYLKYSKNSLNPVYVQPTIADLIVKTMASK